MLFSTKGSDAKRTAVSDSDPAVEAFGAEGLLAARDDLWFIRQCEADGTIHTLFCN